MERQIERRKERLTRETKPHHHVLGVGDEDLTLLHESPQQELPLVVLTPQARQHQGQEGLVTQQ